MINVNAVREGVSCIGWLDRRVSTSTVISNRQSNFTAVMKYNCVYAAVCIWSVGHAEIDVRIAAKHYKPTASLVAHDV